jgi:hypothetical protein
MHLHPPHVPLHHAPPNHPHNDTQCPPSSVQLACSVAIIIMVRYNLETSSISIFQIGGRPSGTAVPYSCLMASEEWPVSFC